MVVGNYIPNCTEAAYQSLVDKYFSYNLEEDVRFYTERLYYENPSQENLNTLAQYYYRCGKIQQCYLILSHSNTKHALFANRYLLALSCFKLDKLEEAELALVGSLFRTGLAGGDLSAVTAEHVAQIPGGAVGLCLLGKICRRQQRKDIAVQLFQLSIKVRA